jgi:hypothetical protein
LVSSWSINFLSIAMGSPIFFFPWPFTQFYLHPHRMRRLITRWLPLPFVCHPYPLRRMGVIT